MRPESRVLQALTRLNQLDDFKLVIGWFEKELKATDEFMRYSKEDYLVRQHQGRSQLLTEILTAIRDSGKTLVERGQNVL